MAARPGGSTDPAGPRGRRLQTVLILLALVAPGTATAVGHSVLQAQERDRLDTESSAVAAAAASSTATLVRRAADALAGADGILRGGSEGEGTVDVGAFERFAAGVVATGTTDAVLLLVAVPADGRAEFEATVAPITTLRPDRSRREAADADLYYPIAAVAPAQGQFDSLGIDFLSDADRGPAMRLAATGRSTVVSDPVDLATTGERGVFVIRPLLEADGGDVMGFVASPVVVHEFVALLADALPPGTEVAITDDGQELAASGEVAGGRARTMVVDLPGQRWEVTARPPHDDRPSIATFVLVAGSALWFAVLALCVVTLRHQRRLRRSNRSLAETEQRSSTLERLASRLSRSLSGADLAGALLESLPGLTGASGGAVSVRSRDGNQLELVAASGYPDDEVDRLARVPVEAATILHEVLTTGEAAYVPSPLGWRDDEALARFADIGMAVAVVPLLDAGEVGGVLVVCQPAVRRFEPKERSLLATIGALAGRALARSLRYDAEHATSLAFQRASLPAVLPETEGLAVTARYRPATSSADIGGDWYDVVALPDGRVAVVVGDVVGHGVTAAAVMGHLRSAVRVLAGALPEPGALLRSLNAEVASIPNAVGATMAYAVVDPAAGTLQHLLAGHPPPLLLRAAGGAELLAGEPWPPLGVTPTDEPGIPTTRLQPGDTVVLYTDGVIERRGESLTAGLERLRAVGEDLGDLVPEDLCDALLEALVPSDDQADDVAVVAIRLLAHPADPDGSGDRARPGSVAATSRVGP